jgi:cell shape-determining protein MreC
VRAIEIERDRWKGLYQNAMAEADDLRKKLEQFGKGAMYAELPVRQILRRVIGTPAEPGGQILVRAGTRDGVEVNSVATAEGVHLVGRVVSVGPRTCIIKLITDKSSGPIDGVIMTPDEARGPKARQLHPVGGGLLQTRVRLEGNEKPPEVGQLVRLDDKSWPRNAQMALVIGAIERPPEPDSVGWYIVTVKPTLDLERLSEVVLRISPEEEDAGRPSPKAGGSTDGGKP